MGHTKRIRRTTERKSVVLTGTFHSGNRGDASIQLSACLELKRRWPDADITLLSPQPDVDSVFYPGVRVAHTARRQPARAAIQIARACIDGVFAVPVDDELGMIKHADLLIDLSGDGFTDTFGWKCPMSHAVPLVLAQELRTPYILMAQTIGPLRIVRAFYRKIMSGALRVICRDRESLDAVLDLKVPPEKVALTADVAFLLPPVDAVALQKAAAWLDDFAANRPLIGLTPSNLFNVRAVDNAQVAMQALVAGGVSLARAAGAKILIIPTVFGPGEKYDDRYSARTVLQMLPADIEAHVCEDELGPREIKALIGRCSAYAGLRMHGIIAALSQHVPTLALPYAAKTCNLFSRMGLQQWLVTDTCCDSVEQKAAELWQARVSIKKAIDESLMLDILPSANRNFDGLEGYLGPTDASDDVNLVEAQR